MASSTVIRPEEAATPQIHPEAVNALREVAILFGLIATDATSIDDLLDAAVLSASPNQGSELAGAQALIRRLGSLADSTAAALGWPSTGYEWEGHGSKALDALAMVDAAKSVLLDRLVEQTRA